MCLESITTTASSLTLFFQVSFSLKKDKALTKMRNEKRSLIRKLKRFLLSRYMIQFVPPVPACCIT